MMCPIEKMCLFVSPPNATASTLGKPLVYVAAGCNEVSLWNGEDGICHQVLKVAHYDGDSETSDLVWALGKPLNRGNSKPVARRNMNPKYRVNELHEPPPRLPGIRSLLALPGGNLVTGGTDLKIRRWDHCSPDRSYSICGPNGNEVVNDDFYRTNSNHGVQIVQEKNRRPPPPGKNTAKAALAAAVTDAAGCHRDLILSLASVKLNFDIEQQRRGYQGLEVKRQRQNVDSLVV